MPGSGEHYVCPQCGPDPRGDEVHAEKMHTWPDRDSKLWQAAHPIDGDLEEHLLDANERMGEALIEIGVALGMPRSRTEHRWGAPEILARIRELRAERAAMREEVAQSILLNSDYARERDQARAERDDARTRADAFAKELTEIAEVLPLGPMLLKPDGTVTPTGPDRPAGQMRALVAERDKLRRQRTAGLQLADNLVAAIDAMPTASATPVVHAIALDIRRALGVDYQDLPEARR